MPRRRPRHFKGHRRSVVERDVLGQKFLGVTAATAEDASGVAVQRRTDGRDAGLAIIQDGAVNVVVGHFPDVADFMDFRFAEAEPTAGQAGEFVHRDNVTVVDVDGADGGRTDGRLVFDAILLLDLLAQDAEFLVGQPVCLVVVALRATGIFQLADERENIVAQALPEQRDDLVHIAALGNDRGGDVGQV